MNENDDYEKYNPFLQKINHEIEDNNYIKLNSKEKISNKKDIKLPKNKTDDFKIEYEIDSRETSFKIAKYLVEKFHTKTKGSKIRDVYIYHEGIYIPGINFLKSEIQKILEEFANTYCKNNIIEMVKDISFVANNNFEVDLNLINFNNGIFNIKNNEFIPHNPDYLFLTKIPINYIPNTECPIILKFLNEILPKKDVKIILQWFGYCLFRSYFIKKAIIFVGERDTGKSTLIKLFERLIGKKNTSGISLQKIASDKFASSGLHNKHINIYDDLSFKDIKDNGLFKIATGNGVITGEKKFSEQFQFENYSKLTYACNKIPDVKDTNDDAFFNRWIIIPFLAEVKVIDKFLIEKMTTEIELSGLLNLAIIGLKEILEKQDFNYEKNPEEIKKEMLLSGSMVANFVENCLKEELDAWISKDEMYQICAEYAQTENLPVVDKNNLGRKLPNHSGYIIDGTRMVDGKQVRGWRNVIIKNQEGYEGNS